MELSVYRAALRALDQAAVPFLVGGSYAFERYTGIARHTKDFDIFVKPEDRDAALAALARRGFRGDLAFPHWLAKAWIDDVFVDVIFGSGNGIACVDELWFTFAPAAEVLGQPVHLVPPEEMIWSKAFLFERERCDMADVVHLLRATGAELDWYRLLARFGERWRVLLAHLVLFGFVYPSETSRVPAHVMRGLLDRFGAEQDAADALADERVCRGTLLSRAQFLVDVCDWGYADARRAPSGTMTDEDIRIWTAAIDERTTPRPRLSMPNALGH
jgi:hypothetical protein